MSACGLFVGVLLPHACDNAAVGTCSQCNRPACEAHLELAPAGLVCRACAHGSSAPLALTGAALTAAAAGALPLFLPADLAAFESADDDEETEDERRQGLFADLS